MGTNYPAIAFFPALPLRTNVTLGEWIVGSPPKDVPWLSSEFRDMVARLLESFAVDRFKDCAMVWHRDRGFDGVPISSEDGAAVQTAVGFAAMDANDRLPRDGNTGSSFSTSENAHLFVQPIDTIDGGITHREPGFWRNNLVGGWKIGQKAPPHPDATMPISSPVFASPKLASATYNALRGTSGRRVRIALEWHAIALSNASAVSAAQRIVAVRTGFEALVGQGNSNARKDAKRLRELFERVASPHRGLLPWEGLIWRPQEHAALPREFRGEPDRRSEIEDWFMQLACVRNKIIHKGEMPKSHYLAPPEAPRSRYAGTLLEIGERVLREAIKATLGADVLLCEPLRKERIIKEMPSLIEFEEDAPIPEPEPMRSVPDLLAELGATSAYEIEVGFESARNTKYYARRDRMRAIDVTWNEKRALLEAGALMEFRYIECYE